MVITREILEKIKTALENEQSKLPEVNSSEGLGKAKKIMTYEVIIEWLKDLIKLSSINMEDSLKGLEPFNDPEITKVFEDNGFIFKGIDEVDSGFKSEFVKKLEKELEECCVKEQLKNIKTALEKEQNELPKAIYSQSDDEFKEKANEIIKYEIAIFGVKTLIENPDDINRNDIIKAIARFNDEKINEIFKNNNISIKVDNEDTIDGSVVETELSKEYAKLWKEMRQKYEEQKLIKTCNNSDDSSSSVKQTSLNNAL